MQHVFIKMLSNFSIWSRLEGTCISVKRFVKKNKKKNSKGHECRREVTEVIVDSYDVHFFFQIFVFILFSKSPG